MDTIEDQESAYYESHIMNQGSHFDSANGSAGQQQAFSAQTNLQLDDEQISLIFISLNINFYLLQVTSYQFPNISQNQSQSSIKMQGLPTKNPILRLEVIPMNSQYLASHQRSFSLNKQDIENVFKVFGEIKEVTVEPSQGYALLEKQICQVTFHDIMAAFFAQQSLNNFYLSKYNAQLSVKWLAQKSLTSEMQLDQENIPVQQQTNQALNFDLIVYYANGGSYGYQQQQLPTNLQMGNMAQQTGTPQQMTQFAYQNIYATSGQNMNTQSQQQNNSPTFIPGQPFNRPMPIPGLAQTQNQLNQQQMQDENIKYTCRFDIQIDNDKEFQVARRLIGAKGCNMKRVIEICCKGASFEQLQDMVKLRLRGKGSGFKEGPKQEESNDPLHLCISSRFYDKYLVACNHVQELIMNVYEEYKRFCEKNKREPKQELTIKKIETVTGRRSVPQNPPHIFVPTNGAGQQQQTNTQIQYMQQQQRQQAGYQYQPNQNQSAMYQQLQGTTSAPSSMFGNYQSTQPFIPQRTSMNETQNVQAHMQMNSFDLSQGSSMQGNPTGNLLPPSLNQQNRSQSFNVTAGGNAQTDNTNNNNNWVDSKPWVPSMQNQLTTVTSGMNLPQ